MTYVAAGSFGAIGVTPCNSTQVLLFVYDLLAEAAERELLTDEEPASSALVELERVFKSAEWCQPFATTFVKMVRGFRSWRLP